MIVFYHLALFCLFRVTEGVEVYLWPLKTENICYSEYHVGMKCIYPPTSGSYYYKADPTVPNNKALYFVGSQESYLEVPIYATDNDNLDDVDMNDDVTVELNVKSMAQQIATILSFRASSWQSGQLVSGFEIRQINNDLEVELMDWNNATYGRLTIPSFFSPPDTDWRNVRLIRDVSKSVFEVNGRTASFRDGDKPETNLPGKLRVAKSFQSGNSFHGQVICLSVSDDNKAPDPNKLSDCVNTPVLYSSDYIGNPFNMKKTGHFHRLKGGATPAAHHMSLVTRSHRSKQRCASECLEMAQCYSFTTKKTGSSVECKLYGIYFGFSYTPASGYNFYVSKVE